MIQEIIITNSLYYFCACAKYGGSDVSIVVSGLLFTGVGESSLASKLLGVPLSNADMSQGIRRDTTY